VSERRADLPFEVPDAGLACVAVDERFDRRVRERDLRLVEAVGLALPRDEIAVAAPEDVEDDDG
jgi:hypothetical protein